MKRRNLRIELLKKLYLKSSGEERRRRDAHVLELVRQEITNQQIEQIRNLETEVANLREIIVARNIHEEQRQGCSCVIL